MTGTKRRKELNLDGYDEYGATSTINNGGVVGTLYLMTVVTDHIVDR